ncbi:FtsX-like permease family protein [Loigolactobacillus coryniformis]|uniref:FtsX-like permease family protein n=1 Tax=Loigolactobacillus coryniformis TaxID=1610 RepID=A0A5B8TLL0_9LACO|nr:ABC transporter permease [Loigolactobacillus coryniformis]QEA53281.1 FtsX-like permease family protein [Loigolactobacillus coryniformis]RRG04921.1 MAG: ABC transporter permease [Lactobacillus sp.]
MLFKLSLTGIKSRFKDYLVLFSGLVMAAAIFYMFEALATNNSFIKANSTFSLAPFVFQFGSVLLAIITFVYILYANSFLLSMRKRDYGLFMMLGAKSGKLGQLIFLETVAIGALSLVIGLFVGIGLTALVGGLLIQRLNTTAAHFNAFYLPAMLVTVIFFLILFVLAALLNQRVLRKTPVLALLKSAAQPIHVQVNPIKTVIQIIFGLACLVVGYITMHVIGTLQILGIAVALVTIVLGTYLVFNSLFTWLLTRLKRHENFASRGLNNFTLAQLNFRIFDYNRMLAMVTLLFALALGAITTGMGFQKNIRLFTESAPYDVILHDPTAKVNQAAAKIKVKQQAHYTYKVTGTTVYFVRDQFDAQPIYAQKPWQKKQVTAEYQLIAGKQMTAQSPLRWQSSLQALLLPQDSEKTITLVDQAAFTQINATTLVTHDFFANLAAIKRVTQLDQQQNKAPINYSMGTTKYDAYQMMNGLLSGFEFMGFFLGVAFLAMLASCLMFKILSGAASDRLRYRMLDKIGTRQRLLRGAIAKEIGVLFLLPGVVGVVHVLFGLQMFTTTSLLPNAYHDLWLPFLIFLVLYGLYYLLTVKLYQNIVLKK